MMSQRGAVLPTMFYLLDGGVVAGHGTPDDMLNSDKPEIKQFMNGLPDGPVGYHYPANDYLDDLGRAIK